MSRTFASSTFTHADENPLSEGGNWTTITGEGDLQIVSNTCRIATLNAGAAAYTARSLPDNQWGQATLALWTGAVLRFAGINLRIDTAAETFYRARAAANSAVLTTSLTKVISGASTGIASENATTWAANDVIYFEVGGTNLLVKRNGSDLLSTTDSAIASGFAGLTMFDNGSSTAESVLDDWSAGALASNTRAAPLGMEIGMNWRSGPI